MMKSLKTKGGRLHNADKYNAYKYAFEMINKSIESGFYLQAITIEESVLCDRLLAILLVEKDLLRKDKLSKATLGSALREWKDGRNTPLAVLNKLNTLLGGYTDFCTACNARGFDVKTVKLSSGTTIRERLHVWWKYRCALLHGLATSTRGESPRFSPMEFDETAKRLAEIGLKHIRIVDSATRKCVKEFLTKGENK